MLLANLRWGKNVEKMRPIIAGVFTKSISIFVIKECYTVSMQTLLFFLILSPWIMAVGYLVVPNRGVLYGALALLGAGGLALFDTTTSWQLSINETIVYLIAFLDALLLGYFVWVGYRVRHWGVVALAAVQIVMFVLIEVLLGHGEGALLLLREASQWMLLIINGVGALIVAFAVVYIEAEAVDAVQKRRFVAYLLAFMGVMNLLVLANEVMLFFLLFELTTLASFVLIGFRDEEEARANALRALWMNQLGGVAILGAVLVAYAQGASRYIDGWVAGEASLLVVALMMVAALIKGATMPFDRWLLGAMVAPTPVSAMLHSATMVKIAPFMVLLFAPAFSHTALGGMMLLMLGFSMAFASYRGLQEATLKGVLGYSTIALLALMMLLALIDTPQSRTMALVLMLFHAMGKALLFLIAGVIERTLHAKRLDAMQGLFSAMPWVMLGAVGALMSLTLPPFGAFWAKYSAIVALAGRIDGAAYMVLVLASVIIASALLVLLYFKLLSLFFATQNPTQRITLSWGYSVPLMFLAAGALMASVLYLAWGAYAYVAWGLLALLVVLLLLVAWLRLGFDRATVYGCGERTSVTWSQNFYSFGVDIERSFTWLFGAMFVAFLVMATLLGVSL